MNTIKDKIVILFDYDTEKNFYTIEGNNLDPCVEIFDSFEVDYHYATPSKLIIYSSNFLRNRTYIIRQLEGNRLYDINIEYSNSYIDNIEYISEINKIKKIYTFDEIEKKLIKNGFTRTLLPFQKDNLLKLINTNCFADFSVPGAGKTTVAIAYFYFLKEPNDKMLVVAPKTTFIAWEKELKECTNGKAILKQLYGNHSDFLKVINEEFDIAIITYEKLRSESALGKVTNYIKDFASQINSNGGEMLILLDESHKAKASGGKTSKAVNEIQSIQIKARYKLILTGTPMTNNMDDLISQYEFAFPNESLSKEQIYDKFGKLFVRTTKEDLGIKDKIVVNHEVTLSEVEQEFYNAMTIAGKGMARVEEGSISISDASQLYYLKRFFMLVLQAATNPSLMVRNKLLLQNPSGKSFIDIDDNTKNLLWDVINCGPSSKMKEAALIARTLSSSGKKVLIWSSFVKNIEEMNIMLEDLNPVYIHGGVDPSLEDNKKDTRKEKIKRFHEDDSCRVLIANPASCAEGISLHKACHDAIYLDRTYTLTNYLQSVDRIHRLGLDNKIDTTIYILQAKNTIDIEIDKSLIAKEERMNKFLNSTNLKELIGIDCDFEDTNNEELLGGMEEVDLMNGLRHLEEQI